MSSRTVRASAVRGILRRYKASRTSARLKLSSAEASPFTANDLPRERKVPRSPSRWSDKLGMTPKEKTPPGPAADRKAVGRLERGTQEGYRKNSYLLLLASHVVIPVHKRAVGVVAPSPNM